MNQRTKYIIAYTFAAAAIIGFLAWAASTENSSGNSTSSVYSASALEAPDNFYDFSTIAMQDGNVSHMYEVKNEGNEPVRIEEIYTSCMCTTASIIGADGTRRGRFGMKGHGLSGAANYEVMPGKSVIIEAVFDPAAHGPSGVGLARRSIYLETNSQTQPKVELRFQALVTR
ncbi:MAG: hypothetical protein COT81_05190 [Candidatus Buchananbacteria bacterium CG10_big_fil_rev_8_21_14_0_10_42_9]|uniref:DUF1573 domain-containing protein n=1 Tax=Candidatus Buchananbacteria bacterium CG10_big_fil_rev_8_21_14_0_10_42_9 TaxID=1974526 RepID=A0A2H0W038_9BACT|nr:MAG: hypothetical protein COT81_05190 [Candidatus Buchananbacteria bacterium CG10_big_fil_rev_8_21_14_0_10_42_9]